MSNCHVSLPYLTVDRQEELRVIFGGVENSWSEKINVKAVVNQLLDRIKELEKSKNAAYGERNKLVAAFSNLYPSHMKRHPESDTEWEDDWRNIVCIHGPRGVMTWHIHDSQCYLFGHLNVKPDPFAGCKYDGHSTDEKYRRLLGSVSGPNVSK